MQRTQSSRGRGWLNVQQAHPFLIVYLCVTIVSSGCRFPYAQNWVATDVKYRESAGRVMSDIAQQSEHPDTSIPDADSAGNTPHPRTLASPLPEDDESKYWDMSLQEAIHFGLTNSRVLNDLGGTILRAPDGVASNLMSAIVQSDPRFGIEGALSAYDTRFNMRTDLQNNDQALNNLFLSGGNTGRTFTQTLETSTAELVKQTVTGGQVAVRNVNIFDRNSAPSNLFPSAWTTYFEAEARQSLLQGGGVEFNRIAGALGQPGYYNGVKIARLRSDITQAEFEMALRDYLSNIENAYWDLHFAYRDLASKVELRDLSLEVYGLYKSRVETQKNEEPYRLAQIREQYYRFQEDVQNALTGRRIDGTRTNNGSIPGTFRSGSGVYLAERRLRLLLGIPTSDERLIRPTDEASPVEVVADWGAVKLEALSRRPELQRQKFQIKKVELELVASRNYLKPRLDIVGKYRLRGFGENLVGYNNDQFSSNPATRFQNAYGNLATGQFQESQAGLEFSMPIGYRQGHAAVAQAEFRVAREKAILHEQERQVIHDAGNAVADVARTHAIVQTASDRRAAASEYLEGLTDKIRLRDFSSTHLEQWLESQRRFAEADTQYHLALCEHQIALKNLNYEKGSLLDYCNVMPVDSNPTLAVDAKSGTQQVESIGVRTALAPEEVETASAETEETEEVTSEEQ